MERKYKVLCISFYPDANRLEQKLNYLSEQGYRIETACGDYIILSSTSFSCPPPGRWGNPFEVNWESEPCNS